MLPYFKENKYNYYQLNGVGAVYIIESSNIELISKLNLKIKKAITKTDSLVFLMDSFVGATERVEFAKEYNRKEFVSILIDNEKQLRNKNISFCFPPLEYGLFDFWITETREIRSDGILNYISSNKDAFKGYIDEIINENDIDLFAPLKPIDPIISITPNDGFRRTIATNGNICLISGDSGIGKTIFSNLFLACSLNKYDATFDNLGLNIKALDGLIVHFDTEQDKETVKQNVNRLILNPLGIKNKQSIVNQYKPQSLVGLSPTEMMRNTERKLDALYRKFGKIDLILVDGAIDYADDFVSDAKQSSIIASKFKFFADLYDCVVLVTMHLNPSRNGETIEKPAGILGSQLVRKTESSIVLVKNSKNKSIKVKFNKHRKSKFIPELEYRLNDYGLIESTEQSRSTEEILDESTLDILTQHRPESIRQSNLIVELLQSSRMSKATIKRYLKELNNGNIVVTTIGKGTYYSLKSVEIDKLTKMVS